MKYKSYKTFQKKTWLPLSVIQQAINENWLDSLCYFVWMRSLHHRPIIYNYSLRKISAQIGHSPTTIKHHIDILSGKGLCERIGANMHLKSINKLHATDRLLVPVGINPNKSKQRDLIRYTVIKRNLHTQFRKFNQKNNNLKLQNLSTAESSLTDYLTLSNQKFGTLCNRSKVTGQKIQASLNKLKLIKSTNRVKLVSAEVFTRRSLFELNLSNAYYLSSDGVLLKRLPNEIDLIGGKGCNSIISRTGH